MFDTYQWWVAILPRWPFARIRFLALSGPDQPKLDDVLYAPLQ